MGTVIHKKAYSPNTLKLATLLDALSHPARLQILLRLAEHNGCMASSVSSRMPLCQSTVSQHMLKLKNAGLISASPEGVCQIYMINYETMIHLRDFFNDFMVRIEDLKNQRKDCSFSQVPDIKLEKSTTK